jgi:hypothetical protein
VGAGFGDWPSWSSCVLDALVLVAKVGSGMATVLDFDSVSDSLLWHDLPSFRLEIDFSLEKPTTKGERAT